MYREDYLLKNIIKFLEELSNQNSNEKKNEIENISLEYFGCQIDHLLSFNDFEYDKIYNKNPDLIKVLFNILISREMNKDSISYFIKGKEVINFYLAKEKIFDLDMNNKLIAINNFIKNEQ